MHGRNARFAEIEEVVVVNNSTAILRSQLTKLKITMAIKDLELKVPVALANQKHVPVCKETQGQSEMPDSFRLTIPCSPATFTTMTATDDSTN